MVIELALLKVGKINGFDAPPIDIRPVEGRALPVAEAAVVVFDDPDETEADEHVNVPLVSPSKSVLI